MLNEEQLKALEFLNNNQNVFITGGAGVGKSYLINEYKKLNQDKNILLCAPTGVASINIGGCTLHRTFRIPVKLLTPNEPLINYQEVMSILRRVDIIIIDEISMCREDVFNYVCRYIKYENQDRINNQYRQGTLPIKLILVGDFYQLPPVITSNEKNAFAQLYNNSTGFAFQSESWKELDIKTFELTTVVRQSDKEFSNCLNHIRKNQNPDLDFLNFNKCDNYIDNAIYLCSVNSMADEFNQKKLDMLNTKEKTFTMRKTGDVSKIKKSDLCVNEVLTLKIGCRVMAVINDTDDAYQNGSLGTVVDFTDNDDVVVQLDNGLKVTFTDHCFDIIDYTVSGEGKSASVSKDIIASYYQIPLKLAYAITIHKSQGQTYDSVNIDLSKIFADGQLYVALSRCKSIQNMHFNGFLSPTKVKVSTAVRQFIG